jgi:hypothetical protein
VVTLDAAARRKKPEEPGEDKLERIKRIRCVWLTSYSEGQKRVKGTRWREPMLGTCIVSGGAAWRISG